MAVAKNRIHVGISAPAEVEIHREEVWKRLLAEEAKEEQERLQDSQSTVTL